MDALELAEKFRDELEQYSISLEIAAGKKGFKPEKPQASIKFLGRNIFEHILLHLKRIRSAELENTLQFLNQKQCFSLLFYLEHFLRNQVQTEMATRAILYILKTYQVQLKQASNMLPLLKSVSCHMKHTFKEMRDMIGVNQSALKIIRKEADQKKYQDDLDFQRPTAGFEF